jgi:hypothetical protein
MAFPGANDLRRQKFNFLPSSGNFLHSCEGVEKLCLIRDWNLAVGRFPGLEQGKLIKNKASKSCVCVCVCVGSSLRDGCLL